jgi:hypothetical protein
MSGQTAKPFACVALLALVSGANLALPANPARAEDCRSAPNAPAPAGTHWYYRLDWATQRKCWYVRAPGRHATQVTAQATIMSATTSRSSDPTPAIDAAPTSPSPSDVAPPSPHAEPSALKAIAAPGSSRTIDRTPGQSALDNSTTPAREGPALQTDTSSETGAQAATVPGTALPDPPIAVASVKTQESAPDPTGNRAEMPDEAENNARSGGPINNGATPMMIFPVLALGLALLGIGSRFLIKRAALRRAQIVMGEPELDRTSNQARNDGRDSLQQQESVVEGQEFHSFISAVSDEGPLRADGDAVKIAREIGKRRHKLAQLRQNIEWMLRSVAGPYAEPRQSFGLPIAKSASYQQ